jgi:tetratricopeptide (TPR) repeat protein
MKNFLLLIFVLPFLGFGQGNYKSSAKKLFKQAGLEYQAGNNLAALDLYKQCVGQEPSFAEAYVNMANVEFNDKSYDKSLSYAKKALKYNKIEHTVYSQIGKSYFMMNNYDSSTYYLNMACVFGGNSAEDFAYLAISENNQNKYKLAQAHISKSIALDEANGYYYLVRGNSNFGLSDFEGAKSDYEKSLNLNPNNKEIYKNLANVYTMLGDSEKALENINLGIKGASGDEQLSYLILQGIYYHKKGDLDNAEKSFSEAYAINNQSAVVLTNQAAVMLDKGEFEQALEKCTKAIDIDPTKTEAYFNRGIANEMLRNTEDACSDWEEAFIMGAVKAEEYLNSPTCNE